MKKLLLVVLLLIAGASPASARLAHKARPFTPAEIRYVVGVQKSVKLTDSCVWGFRYLCANPKPANDKWQDNMTTILLGFHSFAQDRHSIVAPQRFAAFESLYDKSLDQYDLIYQTLPAANGNHDLAGIRRCGTYLGRGQMYMLKARDVLAQMLRVSR